MSYGALRRVSRKYLPAQLFEPIRRVGAACLAPLTFSIGSGHARSSLIQKAVDGRGAPILWITYPAFDLLRAKDLRSRRILEFGAGQSTLWWASQARSVVSFESDPQWREHVVRNAAPNVRVELVPDNLVGAAALLEGAGQFDIVLVDGLDRALASQLARDAVTPDGAIIVDNSEGYWGQDGTFPIMDMFRTSGYQRVDFYGFAPGVVDTHCTSIFFRDSCFLFVGAENPSGLELK